MLLLVTPDGEVLLVKRPNLGIWGGLWSLPECAVDEDLTEYCQRHWQLTPKTISHWPALRHSFSHFHLTIEPVQLVVEQPANWLMESCQQSWYKLAEPNRLGLAAPVKRLLNQLQRIAQTDQDSLCLI
jgi:A/G-specific adenine glycosylase